jgi:hypothetical protein
MDALSSGGLQQTGKDAVGFQSAFRSGSEGYLAKDHQMPERLFRMFLGTLLKIIKEFRSPPFRIAAPTL